MPKLGFYCKAYPLDSLEQFAAWRGSARLPQPTDGSEPADYFFLQEDYCLTADIFTDSHIVLDGATPEWKDFCTQTLKFEAPARDHSIVRTFYE